MTFHWWEKNVKLDFLIWTQLLIKTDSRTQSWFFELVLFPEPITLKPKSTIPPSHILLLDIGIDQNDSAMIFQDWSCKENNIHDRIFHDPIHIGDCKYVNRKEVNKGKGEFREPPHYLDWVATLDPIRLPSEPPPRNHHHKVIFSFPFFFFMHLCINSYIEDNTWDRCGGGL